MTGLPIEEEKGQPQLGIHRERRILKSHGHPRTATGAVTKASTAIRTTTRPRKGELWETRKVCLPYHRGQLSMRPHHRFCLQFSPNDRLSYHREVTVLSTVSRLRPQSVHAPKIISDDPRSGVLVLSYPRLRWATLAQRIGASEFGLDTLRQMKDELCSFIELLYGNGVAYLFREDCVFPVKLASGHWALYLGGWKDANFCPFSDRLDSAQLKERQRKLEKWKAKQLEKIESHFALLRTRATAKSDGEARATEG
jgi:hypothetical protein